MRSAFEIVPSTSWALFLDVDGTLVDFVATPDQASIRPETRDLIAGIADTLGGAVALISGRRIADLDRIFAPLRLPAAGAHGCERGTSTGHLHSLAVCGELLALARAQCSKVRARQPGLVIEDKGTSLALHFRQEPGLEANVRTPAMNVAAALGDAFHVQEGSMVMEVEHSRYNKATAIGAFTQESPFAGRVPVFLGDDLTDRDGFEAVSPRGGIAIAVGDRVTAPWILRDPSAVWQWLGSLGREAACR